MSIKNVVYYKITAKDGKIISINKVKENQNQSNELENLLADYVSLHSKRDQELIAHDHILKKRPKLVGSGAFGKVKAVNTLFFRKSIKPTKQTQLNAIALEIMALLVFNQIDNDKERTLFFGGAQGKSGTKIYIIMPYRGEAQTLIGARPVIPIKEHYLSYLKSLKVAMNECFISYSKFFEGKRFWVHRDIKPDNIISIPIQKGKGYEVNIIDFGIASFKDPEEKDSAINILSGTPDYNLFLSESIRHKNKKDKMELFERVLFSNIEPTYYIIISEYAKITEDKSLLEKWGKLFNEIMIDKKTVPPLMYLFNEYVAWYCTLIDLMRASLGYDEYWKEAFEECFDIKLIVNSLRNFILNYNSLQESSQNNRKLLKNIHDSFKIEPLYSKHLPAQYFVFNESTPIDNTTYIQTKDKLNDEYNNLSNFFSSIKESAFKRYIDNNCLRNRKSKYIFKIIEFIANTPVSTLKSYNLNNYIQNLMILILQRRLCGFSSKTESGKLFLQYINSSDNEIFVCMRMKLSSSKARLTYNDLLQYVRKHKPNHTFTSSSKDSTYDLIAQALHDPNYFGLSTKKALTPFNINDLIVEIHKLNGSVAN